MCEKQKKIDHNKKFNCGLFIEFYRIYIYIVEVDAKPKLDNKC